MKKRLKILQLMGLLIFPLFSYGAESLSYSGRLVNNNGSPVAGPVNLKVELSYTNAPSTILCSQDFTNVALSSGVFHLKLDLNCGSDSLTEVLSATPVGETAAIRVTDTSHSKVYAFQALHSMPFANIAETAKQLAQMGATNGQFLKWNNTTKKWEPGSVAGGSGGTVTEVNVTAPLAVSNATSTPSLSIPAATTSVSGYLTSTDWNTFNGKEPAIAAPASPTTKYWRGDKAWTVLDTAAVSENVANLYFTNARVLGVPLTGFSVGSGAIAQTDDLLTALGKVQGQINDINTDTTSFLVKNGVDAITGEVEVGTTGSLLLTYTPVNMNDAVNKAYVDNLLDFSELKLKSGANHVTIKPHATSANYNFVLPQTAGTSGYVLTTDGSGNLSWVNPSTTTAGSATVNSAAIVDGTIVDADINASAAIAQSKIANLTNDLAGKEPALTAGTNTQYYRGDKTWQALQSDAVAEGSTNLYFQASRVRASDLTGLNTGTSGAITSADTVLSAFGKLQYQVTDINLKGVWEKSGSNVYYDAGSVGVGVTLPAEKLHVGGNAIVEGKLRLKSDNTNYVELRAPASLGSTLTYTFPGGYGSSGQVLSSNGSGGLSWIDVATTSSTVGGDLTGTITNAQIASGVVTSTEIADGTITATDIASNTITYNKLNLTDGDIPLAKLNGTSDATKYLRGDKSWSDFAADVRSVVLTGFSTASSAVVAATDSILVAIGKLQSQITVADATTSSKLTKNGTDSITGLVTISGAGDIQTSSTPVGLTSLVNKSYVDNLVATGTNQWTTSSSNIYRPSGKVGIGFVPWNDFGIYKANASAQADIISDNTSTNTARYPTIRVLNYAGSPATGNAGNPSFVLVNMRGTSSASQVIRSGESLGAFSFNGSSDTAQNYKEGASIWATATENFSTTAAGSSLTFYTTLNGTATPSPRVTIDNTGYLGIGTTAPASPLSIKDSNWSSSEFSTYNLPRQMLVSDTYTNTSAGQYSGASVVSIANAASNSSSIDTALQVGQLVPSSQTVNYGNKIGIRSTTSNLGSGAISGLVAGQFIAKHSGAGTASSVSGLTTSANNSSTGIATSMTGLIALSSNNSTGTVTNQIGLQSAATNTSGTVTSQYGILASATHNANTTLGTQYGIFNSAVNGGTGTVSNSIATYSQNYNGSTGTVTSAIGNWGHIWNGGAGTISDGFALYGEVYNPGGGTITNGYGLYLANIQATNKWSIYANDSTAPSYFAAKVGIGTKTPISPLTVYGSPAAPTLSTSNTNNPSGALFRVESNEANGLSVGVYGSAQNYATWFQSSFMGSSPAVAYNLVLNPMGGNVGIGTSSPTAPLYVSTTSNTGNIATFISTATGGAGCSIAWNGTSCSSDARLKQDVETVDKSETLHDLLKLNPVHFTWIKDPRHEKQTGFIAQELEKHFPEFVKTDERGYKQVNYAHFVSVLTASIQEIFTRQEAQGRSIASKADKKEVEAQIKELKDQNATKDREIKELRAYLCSKDPKASICAKKN